MTNLPPGRGATTSVAILFKSHTKPLAHLSSVLNCEPTWHCIRGRVVETRTGLHPEPHHLWTYCLYDHNRVSSRLDEYLVRMRQWLLDRSDVIEELLQDDAVDVILQVWCTVDTDVAALEMEPVVWRALLRFCKRAAIWIVTLDEK